MKYLGIDYGEKRIGIAASDARGVFAFARETIENGPKMPEKLLDFIKEETAEAIVIGMPETASGAQNPVEEKIREFAESLKEASGLEIYFQNEQFSSIESSRFAPEQKKDDAVSAAIILQRYLDAHPQAE